MKFSKSQNMERQASLNSLRQALEIWSEKKLSDLQANPEDLKSKWTVLRRFRFASFFRHARSLAYQIKFSKFRSVKIKIQAFVARTLSSRR
jgi:hypothetical protein